MTLTLAIDLIAGLALAVAFGGMTFFSAVVAPLVFVKLPAATAGGFIRELFPWYYLTLGAVSLIATLALLGAGRSSAALLAGVTVLGFVVARQWLMPAINAARDAKQPQRFNRLHRLSVIINGLQWLLLGAALVLVLR